MKIKNSEFISSNLDYRKCPKTKESEIALIGRSNVGKSSLINSVLKKKSITKVSNKPGKTKFINHFLINKKWYLVDLPGYGWSKVDKKEKSKIKKIIKEYILYRKNLSCIYLLIDSKIDIQKIDIKFINWLILKNIYFAIVLTKSEKNINESKEKIENFKKIFKYHNLCPDFLITSSHKKIGINEVLKHIGKLI